MIRLMFRVMRYVQSDTLLLENIFENFRNMYIKVYELDPAHFLAWISMTSLFKENGGRIRLMLIYF